MVCYAFSLPPTPFVKQMNRATAATVHDAALEEGLAPLQLWVTQFINHVIQEDFGISDLAFGWVDDREVDPKIQMETLTGYVTKGGLKINEMRDQLGQPPVPGGDVLMVLTANGYVPIDVNADMPTAGETAEQNAANAEALLNAKSQNPEEEGEGGEGEDGKDGPPPPKGDKKEPPDDAEKLAGGAAEKVAATFRKEEALRKRGSSSSYDPRYGSLAKRHRALRKNSSPRSKGNGASNNGATSQERLLEDPKQSR